MALFWDRHAEQAAHGAALANDSACAVYVRELAPEAFYKPRDQGIAAAIRALHRRGDKVDAVTVAAERGADADEKAYLHTCAEFVPSAAAVAEYAAVVNHNARCRHLQRESTRAQEALANGNGEGETRFREILTQALEDAAGPAPPLAPAFLDWPASWDRERGEAEWVYPDVLARGRGHALYASHKLGKSLLMLSIAAQLATGEEPVVCVYLDYEMTLEDVLERLDDMGYRGADLSRLRYALLPDLPPLDAAAGGAALMAMLDGVRAAWPGHHLVLVIDTISRAVAGDENSADTYRAFYAHTGIELKRREVTWVRLDHAGKDDGAGQRGSSAKGDDIDLAWRLERSKGRLALRRDLSRMPWVPERVDVPPPRGAAALRRASSTTTPRARESWRRSWAASRCPWRRRCARRRRRCARSVRDAAACSSRRPCAGAARRRRGSPTCVPPRRTRFPQAAADTPPDAPLNRARTRPGRTGHTHPRACGTHPVSLQGTRCGPAPVTRRARRMRSWTRRRPERWP